MGPILARLMFITVILSCFGIFSIFIIIFLSSVFVGQVTNMYNQNLRYKPVAFNVDTNNTSAQISTGTSLFLIEQALAETVLINTGQSVQNAIQVGNAANITGGPLGNNTYIYQSFTYYWASNSSGITGTTIDGKGGPYEVRVLFMNNKYDKISQAVKYQDGLAELVFPFSICSTTNQQFDQLSQYIRNITYFGNSLLVPLGTQFAAAAQISSNFPHLDNINSMHLNFNQPYYSYNGIFIDTVTGKTYQCSTVIIFKFNPQNCCITQDQFNQTFIPLKDTFVKPLFNTLTYNSSAIQASLYTNGAALEMYF